MKLNAPFDQIPRGNTAPGVHRSVIEYLAASGLDLSGQTVLDVPCGNGEFLDTLKVFFPNAAAFGVDIDAPENASDHHILKVDLSEPGRLDLDIKFRLITSISGVMEFDNTLNFFRQLRRHIADDSMLIVTNDNLLSARDRSLYFFSGRFRQYPMFVGRDAPTWKIVHLENLLRILYDAGFNASEVRYVPSKWTEWLWLPVALPVYLIQSLSFAFCKNGPPYKEKAARYPFASLFSRHYFVVCGSRN